MTTVVSVAQGGTGSNSAALARTALGVPPSAAYDQANTARDQANTARTQANTGYDQANTARGQANTAYAQANAAYGQANSAYGQANAAYGAANTRLSASGGTLSGDLIITGNLTVSGNSTTLNAEILTIEDADVVLLSNVASTPALNAGIIVNRGTSTNTFLRWAENVDEWGWSDNGTTTYFFEDLRQGLITTNTTFGTVNTNITNTNSNAINAYAQANSAFAAANNRVLKAGDTMTGQLNISSGGLLVTGNVGFGTASPSRRLHLSSSGTDCGIRIDNTVSGRPALLLYDDSQNLTITNSSDTGYIGFINGTGAGTERVRIANTGNVGIGTTAPYSSLHLAGDLTMGSGSNARPALKITNWGYSASYRALMIGSPNTLYTTANTGAVTVCFNYDPSVNPNSSFSGDGREIIFRRGTRFVTPNSADNAFNLTNLVLYDGAVGIGLDAPVEKLHVEGTNISGAIYDGAMAVGGNRTRLKLGRDNNYNAGLSGYVASGQPGVDRVSLGFHVTTFTSSVQTFYEAMTLTDAGRLGIGRTDPQATLHVQTDDPTFIQITDSGNIATRVGANGSALTFGVDGSNGTTERARITNNGDLCVGSLEPGNAGVRNISIGNPGTTVGGLQLWSTTSGTHYVQFGDSASGAAPYSGAVGYVHASDAMTFWTAQAERARFNSTGALVFAGGTTNASGIGIAFPATQSASTDANTLDDYEEGTWTPELRDGATVLTQAYSYRSGVYHKIGRMVHVHFGFLLSSLSGTGTGALRVYGLPFTGATTGGYQEPMGYAILGNQPTASHSNSVYFFNMSGTAILEARLLTGVDTVYTSNNIDGDTFMKFSMIYWV